MESRKEILARLIKVEDTKDSSEISIEDSYSLKILPGTLLYNELTGTELSQEQIVAIGLALHKLTAFPPR